MKWVSRLLMIVGVVMIGVFGYSAYDHANSRSVTLEEAEQVLNEYQAVASTKIDTSKTDTSDTVDFQAEEGDVFGILSIPKLDRSIGIVEGSDENALKSGVGHVASTVLPGQNEQIVLSGHRDTVFRDFGELDIGDIFVVQMPYGDFEYEIRESKIVDQNDRTVIGKMGEEALVVSTCYPFNFVGFAPQRYVLYAYPR